MADYFTTSVQDWQYGLSAFFILGIFLAAAEVTRKYLGWSGEVTRKLTHIGTGSVIFFSPLFLSSKIPALTLGIFFTVFNLIALRLHWLKGIHGTARISYGTVYYPLAFSLLIFFCWDRDKPALMIAMAVLALGDPFAAVVGGRWKHPHRYHLCGDGKSLEGSVGMFAMSFLVVVGSFYYLSFWNFFPWSLEWIWPISVAVAMLATVAEALSFRGSDNLTIPICIAFVIHVMTHSADPAKLILAVGASALITVGSLRFKFLNPSGAAGAFILGSVIFGIGGWIWAAPILTFFITSSVLSKWGSQRKRAFDLVFEKGNTRDIGQVIGNGGLAGAVVLADYFFPNPQWYPVFLGIVAAVTCDTWATEVGIFFRQTPRNPLNFHAMEPGSSGGMTLSGTVGGLAGAGAIAACAAAVNPGFSVNIFWILFAGLAGSLADSVLGATVQAQYRCDVCGKTTEQKKHCEQKSKLIRRFEWVDNDRVNLICGLTGGLTIAAAGIYLKQH